MIKEIVYTVKSHQRVDRFRDKTYNKIILHYGFPLDKVYVFVSTEQDFELYTKAYPELKIVLAPAGVAAVDNFITNYFDEGQKIIYMNDDVTALVKVSEQNKFVSLTKQELEDLCSNMFAIMEANHISYGGFYNIPNTMFMLAGAEVVCGLCFIQDPFCLVVNNKQINITVSDKSDFEKSIQHFASRGAILRYNRVVFKVENFVSVGGFQGRTIDSETNSAEKMISLYPEFIAGMKTNKAGTTTSLRLKKLNPCFNIETSLLGGQRETKKEPPQLELF